MGGQGGGPQQEGRATTEPTVRTAVRVMYIHFSFFPYYNVTDARTRP